MTEFLVGPISRRRFRLRRHLPVVALSVLALGGCSGSAASNEQTIIGIETSQFSVVVENKVGMPLVDVDVSIVPAGRAVVFSKLAGRLDNGEKREISLGSFYGRDGTPFSLRVVRPKSVRVTAKDFNNKPIEVEVPWK
jgi:hypothetical protein